MRIGLAVLVLSLGWFSGLAAAQHVDVLVQVDGGKIVTGAADFDSNTWLIGERVFEREFLSNFRATDPGFTSLESGSPLLEPGVLGFAPGVDLLADIVPTSLGGVSANYWYWDGLDDAVDGFSVEDVSFGSAPAGVTWNLIDEIFQLLSANGSGAVVPNALVQTAFSDGGVHNHLLVQVADNDGNSSTTPPQGVYLAALVLHAQGYTASEPFFFVHRTSGLTNAPRDAAAQWARDNYAALVQQDLPGDYNGDGSIDAADYTVWRDTLGSTTELAADGDGDLTIGAGDYNLWRNAFGSAGDSNGIGGTGVPEPTGVVLIASALFGYGLLHRERA